MPRILFQKGHVHSEEIKQKISKSLKGRKLPDETKLKIKATCIKQAKFEEQNRFWKGDMVGYSGVHAWVRQWKGQPSTCEKCGKEGLSGRKIGWANIDHKYRRVLDDYIRLCTPCHRQYDKQFNQPT